MLLWELKLEPHQEDHLGTVVADSRSGGQRVYKESISLEQMLTFEESIRLYVQTDVAYFRKHSWEEACSVLLISNII